MIDLQQQQGQSRENYPHFYKGRCWIVRVCAPKTKIKFVVLHVKIHYHCIILIDYSGTEVVKYLGVVGKTDVFKIML